MAASGARVALLGDRPLEQPRCRLGARAARCGARGGGRRRRRRARDDPIVGIVSVNGTLLDLDGASYLTFDGLAVGFGRDVGVRARNTTGVIFSNGVIANVGNMAVNASGGSGLLIDATTVRGAGNGAVYFYAGDRASLARANHTLHNSSASYSNRYMYCYVPMVALGDCGSRVVASELFGGPHQGVFMSGNYHELRNSSLHHLVQAASDSGAVYTGRDFTYQGSIIDGNAFRHINSLDGGDTAVLYLDDEVSGYTMTHNYCTFNAQNAAPARCARKCDPNDPKTQPCVRPTTLNLQLRTSRARSSSAAGATISLATTPSTARRATSPSASTTAARAGRRASARRPTAR